MIPRCFSYDLFSIFEKTKAGIPVAPRIKYPPGLSNFHKSVKTFFLISSEK